MKSFWEFLEQKKYNKVFKENFPTGAPRPAGTPAPTAKPAVPGQVAKPAAPGQVAKPAAPGQAAKPAAPGAVPAKSFVPATADNDYGVFYQNLISPPGNFPPAKAIELTVRKFPKQEKEIRDDFAAMSSLEKYPDGDHDYGSYYQGLIDHGMTSKDAIELVVKKFPSDEKEIRNDFAAMSSLEKYPDGDHNYGSYYQGLIDHGMTPENAIELVVKKFPSDEKEIRYNFAGMNARKNVKRV